MHLHPALPRLLGVCFYYPPRSATMQPVVATLTELPDLFPWENTRDIESLTIGLANMTPQQLQYDYSILFEGQGQMPAPPWGSYYLEIDQLLMGESTIAFRHFLHNCGIKLNTEYKEPEDQFGLMLLALSLLLDKKELNNAQKLLNDFLSPWAFRYLDLVQNTVLENSFYPNLAYIAEQYLRQLNAYCQKIK